MKDLPQETSTQELLSQIAVLKKEREAVILAHNYQPSEIQDLADFTGDSLELSRIAAKTPAKGKGKVKAKAKKPATRKRKADKASTEPAAVTEAVQGEAATPVAAPTENSTSEHGNATE